MSLANFTSFIFTSFVLLTLAHAQLLSHFTHINSLPAQEEQLSQWVESSAAFAVKSLNSQKEEYRLEEFAKDGVVLGGGILYSTLLEGPNGLRVAFDFVEPKQLQWLGQQYLPSGEETQTESEIILSQLQNPRMGLTLGGPLNVYFDRPKENIELRMPNLVEAGTVSKIVVEPQVNFSASGLTGMKILSPLDIEIEPQGEQIKISWKQPPRIELRGDKLHFSSQERTKVKRKGPQELSFASNTQSTSSQTPSSFIMIPSNHAVLQSLELTFGDGKALDDKPTFHSTRIVTGTASAVTLVNIPMILSKSGVHSVWKILVALDAFGEKRLLSSEEIIPPNQVTVANSLVINGTVAEAIDNFQAAQPSQQLFAIM